MKKKKKEKKSKEGKSGKRKGIKEEKRKKKENLVEKIQERVWGNQGPRSTQHISDLGWPRFTQDHP